MHPEGTKRGDLARKHDRLAAGMVTAVMRTERPWIIENPEAYLRMQSYMSTLDKPRVVHYCQYWTPAEARSYKPIKKPTTIWTNVHVWTPMGDSGTGLCCNCQFIDPRTGRHPPMEGSGTRAQKGRHPERLIQEWFSAWA
jgi:hypothetical protein